MQISSLISIISATINAFSSEKASGSSQVRGHFPILDLNSKRYLCFQDNGLPGYFYSNPPHSWQQNFQQSGSGEDEYWTVWTTVDFNSQMIEGVASNLTGYNEMMPLNDDFGQTLYLIINGNSQAGWEFQINDSDGQADGQVVDVYVSNDDEQLALYAPAGYPPPENYVVAYLGTVNGM